MVKPLVIHHSADADGIASLAMVQQGLQRTSFPQADAIGWDYGQPTPKIDPSYSVIYMVDVTVDELLKDAEFRRKTVLIDHHRTALEKWGPHQDEFLDFVVIEGIAASRLCFAYFTTPGPGPVRSDIRQYFKKPMPLEPFPLFLIGLRDVWAHRGTEYEEQAQNLEAWIRGHWVPYMPGLINSEKELTRMLADGASMLKYGKSVALEHAADGARTVEIEGVCFLALNTPQRGSMALDAYSQGCGMVHDALMVWCQLAPGDVRVSMYHAPASGRRPPNRPDIDLSQIAKRFGGGGHPGACGFRIPLDQWLPIIA